MCSQLYERSVVNKAIHKEEAALLEWLMWLDHVEAPSSSGLRHPEHPHWGAQPPEPGYCS